MTSWDGLWDCWPGRASVGALDLGKGRTVEYAVAGARTSVPTLDVYGRTMTSPNRFDDKLARLRLDGAWFEVEINGRTLRYCLWAYGTQGRRRRRKLSAPLCDTFLALLSPEYFLRRPPDASPDAWRERALLAGVISHHWWRCGDERCETLGLPNEAHYGLNGQHRSATGWCGVLLAGPEEAIVHTPDDSAFGAWVNATHPDSVWGDWNRSFLGAALLPELAFHYPSSTSILRHAKYRLGAVPLGELPPASEWHEAPASLAIIEGTGLRWVRRLEEVTALPADTFDPVRRRSDARVRRALDALPRQHVAWGGLTRVELKQSKGENHGRENLPVRPD